MIKRFPLTIVLATAIVALLLAPAADAGSKKKFGTSINISYSSESLAFTGKVGSKVPRCERGRTVTVYAKPEGGDAMAFGSDETDSKGRYSIAAPLLPVGSYYAVVDRKATPRTVCLGARTGPIAR